MTSIYATIFFTIITVTSCNFWDNLFSNLYSPHYIIPNETKLEVSNNGHKMMEILVSSRLNAIKISLLDSNITRPILNTTNFTNIFINFTNGTIDYQFDNNCTSTNISALSKITSKFILNSYDILSYFKISTNFFEYYVTNPIARKDENEQNKIHYSLPQATNLRRLNNLEYLDSNSLSDNALYLATQLFGIKEIQDKNDYILFKVNKTTSSLEKMSLKFQGFELLDLNTIYTPITEDFDIKVFQSNQTCSFKNNIYI